MAIPTSLQSYSEIVDHNLSENDLPRLGQRLKLPKGWRYSVRTLTKTYALKTVGGKAAVLQDDLTNSYQRIDSSHLPS